MNKLILTLCLGFLFTGVRAQTISGAKVVTTSQALKNSDGSTNYSIQVGVPYSPAYNFGQMEESRLSVRFPWDVLYLFPTFIRADNSFEISKGYYGDKILINWKIKNNINRITTLKLYRREYNDTPAQWKESDFLLNISKNESSYEDKYVEGGVLYEYKLYADGVSQTEEFGANFITGIGFRSPTAVVTGNVSYEGGSPVKDVVIKAISDGGTTAVGSALNIPSNSEIAVTNISKTVTAEATFQAWLKPESPYVDDAGASMRLFKLESSGETNSALDVRIKLLESSKILEVNIGGSVYKLHNYYPAGALNYRGDEKLNLVSQFNKQFVHFTVIIKDKEVPTLFINGRVISAASEAEIHENLVAADNKYLEDGETAYSAPYYKVEIPVKTNSLALTSLNSKWNNIYVGGGESAIVDEIRVWNSVLDTAVIRTDFKRYISGNHSSLITYLKLNEGAGDYAYDFSRSGFLHNKNNGKLNATDYWITGEGNIPTDKQLGVLGVTNAVGNYEITAIPYSGTGESFTITPIYGQHQFEPGQQLIFLGQGSEVVNKVDFLDKSSFVFKGKILYDTRGVFKPFDANRNITGTILPGEYNSYDVNGTPYPHGEYWLNEDDIDNRFLANYSPIYVEGVKVYIDGEEAKNSDGTPILSKYDENTGTAGFQINVPIGRHYITVKKDGHVFEHDGRFPKASDIEKDNTKEFVENSESEVVFIDKTKVEVVGRVVGGAVQAQKVIGFGDQGAVKTEVLDADGVPNTINVSSNNNIGQAKITVGYGIGLDDPLENNKYTITTHKETGEFRATLLPLDYSLAENDIVINSNNAIKFYEPGFIDNLKFSEITKLITPKFAISENDTLYGNRPYHHSKIFEYRTDPTINVIKQTYDDQITIRKPNGDEISISTEGFVTPVYTQFETYALLMEAYEKYTNYDDGVPDDKKEDLVPVIDGNFEIDNGLKLEGTELTVNWDNLGTKVLHTWQAGEPIVVDQYSANILIKYNRNGEYFHPNSDNYEQKGIVLGGKNDGSSGVLTAAPDIPDFILRDPPGSNSFASIEAGSSISITEQLVSNNGIKFSNSEKIKTGMISQIGGGMTGPIFTHSNYNDFKTGSSYELSSSNGNTITKKYTFNQTISTSSEPDFVGSDGDLYIGKSKNYYYGTYHKIEALESARDGSISLKNSKGEEAFISRTIGETFTEDPNQTTFMYSQKYILETLIPKLQTYIDQYASGDLQPDNDEFLSSDEYKEQITLWKNFIQENEQAKYQALYQREEYIANIKNNIQGQIAEYATLPELVTPALDAIGSAGEFVEEVPSWIWSLVSVIMNKGLKGTGGAVGAVKDIGLVLNQRKNALQKTLDFLEENAVKNYSLDAGVGEYKSSSEINLVSSQRRDIKLKTSAEFLKKTGAESNGLGFIKHVSLRSSAENTFGVGEEKASKSVVSYTLKDNDKNNFISVDVVNSFDGNGPIFSTKGGRTSCPYEGEDLTEFFNNSDFELVYEQQLSKLFNISRQDFATQHDNPNLLDNDVLYDALIRDMAVSYALENVFSGNEKIGVATERIEEPMISVLERKKINIPESRLAEFDLTLYNNSVVDSDADFLLLVNLDNLNGAKINIEPNGTIIHIPFGQSVKYKLTLEKVAADVFDYENIEISLRSLCDGENNSAMTTVEAHFIPVCSEVVIASPLPQWRYNLAKAYDTDNKTKPLNIVLNNYSTAFAGFQKIVLDYRYMGSWRPLQTYYADKNEFDAVILADNKAPATFIGGDTSLSYQWDIAGLKLPNGEYEIRARTFCDKSDYTAEIIKGSVDLIAPKRFGTPLPNDGILGAGEDLKVSFSEDIYYNSLASQIQILGLTNQELIDNNTSLYFEGNDNTVTINNPKITTGDLTLQFWLNNSTQNGNATIVYQKEGLQIGLAKGELFFTLGGYTAKSPIINNGTFNHYTFTHINDTGELLIYENGQEIASTPMNSNVPFTNNYPLILGGNTFTGNIHSLMLWNKFISEEDAFAKMRDKLIGNETNLIGYWPMNEGRGDIAKDLARFKHAEIRADWDIKPKGTAYEFKDGHYLEIDASVILTDEMDATISFWMKTGVSQDATLFSNGRGDQFDDIKPDGKRNKWAINLSTNGNLTLLSEEIPYVLASQNMADNKWHHVAILFNRHGSLTTYVDAAQVSTNQISKIGAFKDSNKIWLGARGHQDAGGFTVDNTYTGKLDEFRIWNTLRNVEQVNRDRYNEMDFESIGLALYARLNEPETTSANGPRFYYMNSNPTKLKEVGHASPREGALNYTYDVPPVKPARKLTDFRVNYTIKEGEMILEPDVLNWSVIEGQVLDITVGYMQDAFGNIQESPITWTAYVKRNEMSWFAEGYNEVIDIVKNSNEDKSFEITVLNQGGQEQLYSISNIPSWLTLSKTEGVLSPASKTIIIATIDKNLTTGGYLENLFLQTEFGYDEKLQIDLTVLAPEPKWDIDPALFDHTMNIVGKIKIDDKFSSDSYDKIAAFNNEEVRGSANLVFNEAYQEYYVFLTLYSDSVYGEIIEFRVWDASQGKIIEATVNLEGFVTFRENEVLGTLSTPTIFENTAIVKQEIPLNKGWTWISMNVNDVNFSNMDKLTEDLNLETSDRFLSHSPIQLETYYKNENSESPSGWNGQISANGGLSNSKMYKIHMANEQSLMIKGVVADVSKWSFPIQENWNWLPNPLSRNQTINEALAYFDAVDGDVIKSQNLFAIYDPIVGWNGTMSYLEAGKGYMVKSSKAQTFSYPSYLENANNNKTKTFSQDCDMNCQDFTHLEFNKYAENMNAVVLMPEGYTELYVYDTNGALKGVGKSQYLNDKALSFITVYGEAPESLVFHIGDGFIKKATTNSFEFISNGVLGTISEPVKLNIEKEFRGIYPNPFTSELSIQIEAEESQTVTIRLYTLGGQMVLIKELKANKGINSFKIIPKVASGTYMLSAEMNDRILNAKVIKK